MGRFSALAKAWGVTERQAARIAGDMGEWATLRIDNAIDQPSRAAGRFGSGVNPGRPIGAGLKTGGIAVGGGAAVYGGSQFYDSYSKRQTAAEENEIDAARAEAIANLLNDPDTSPEEKERLIRELDRADFFRNTDITPEAWYEKLGITPNSLNPVNFLGGGISGVVAFLVIAWVVVRLAQSAGGS